MNEFTFPPKYKVGDLVHYTITNDDCDEATTLGVVVQVEPSTINKLPIFWVHLPNGNQGLAFQSELRYADEK